MADAPVTWVGDSGLVHYVMWASPDTDLVPCIQTSCGITTYKWLERKERQATCVRCFASNETRVTLAQADKALCLAP